MRISDWSSDVCSSDLRSSTLVPVAQGLPRVVHSCRDRGFGETQANLSTTANRAVPLHVANEIPFRPEITARSPTASSLFGYHRRPPRIGPNVGKAGTGF